MHRSSLLVVLIATALAGCATQPTASDHDASTVKASAPAVAGSPDSPLANEDRSAHESAAGLASVVVTNPLAPKTVDLTAHADDIWDRIRVGYAIPNIESPEVAQQQAWYLAHQEYLQRAVERSSLYLYHVVEELEKRNMPTELALLPFIESAYNPMAYSKAHASGMWQFIPSTGTKYNLKQDWWKDQRRDVIASTDAALTYLQALYEMHGDWQLALASYNWGEGSVKRAIERNVSLGKPTDYLSLSMPDETRNYLPKLQAIKNLIANPALFGIALPKVDNQPYFVTVARTRAMDVTAAARLAQMPLDQFRALNPSFNRALISGADSTPLLIPKDRASLFESNLENHEQPLATWQPYTLRRGEHLDRVAARFGMTLASLKAANDLPARMKVHGGETLLVQRRTGGESDHDPRAAMIAATESVHSTRSRNGSRRLFAVHEMPVSHRSNSRIMRASLEVPNETRAHVVGRKETLYSIATHYHVGVASLQKANHLKGTRLEPGQRLKIPE